MIVPVTSSSGDSRPDFKICVQRCVASSACHASSTSNSMTRTSSTAAAVDEDEQQRQLNLKVCSSLCNRSSDTIAEEELSTEKPHWQRLALTMTSWDCISDCRYLCMWNIETWKRLHRKLEQHRPYQSQERTNTRRDPVLMTEKYFGKWPFTRFLGAQEPASVVFSIFNFIGNCVCGYGIVRVLSVFSPTNDASSNGSLNDWNWSCLGFLAGRRTYHALSSFSSPSPQQQQQHEREKAHTGVRHRRPENYSLYRLHVYLWLGHFLLASNAWLWSAVFHTRDTKTTERWDYFSAGGLVVYNLYVSLIRVMDVKTPSVLIAIAAALALSYGWHVHSMMTVLFDYGRHVQLCIAAGALQTLSWAIWAVFTSQGRIHPGRKALLWFMAAINVAMASEILDFPPLFDVVDAHALWHAATAPLIWLWYRFVKADVVVLREHFRKERSV